MTRRLFAQVCSITRPARPQELENLKAVPHTVESTIERTARISERRSRQTAVSAGLGPWPIVSRAFDKRSWRISYI